MGKYLCLCSQLIFLLVRLTSNFSYAMSNDSINCSADFDDCRYKGDMCGFDADKCWRRMRNGYCIDPCFDLIDNPQDLYIDRGDAKYSIKIPDHVRLYYPEKMTYTIVRIASYSKFSEEGSVEVVPNCCAIGLEETCFLPTRRNLEERFYAMFPLKALDDGYPSYCYHDIEEQNKPDKWCTSKEEMACNYVDSDGNVQRRSYISLNSEIRTHDTVICALATGQDLKITVPDKVVVSLYLDSSGGFVKLPNGKRSKYTERKDVHNDRVFEAESPVNSQHEYDFNCCILGGVDGLAEAMCMKTGVHGSVQMSVIVICIIVSFVVTAVITISTCTLYRKHAKRVRSFLKATPFHVQSEVLEDSLYMNMEQTSGQEDADKITWSEDSKEDNHKFHQPENDSGFRDYLTVDAVPDNNMIGYVEGTTFDESVTSYTDKSEIPSRETDSDDIPNEENHSLLGPQERQDSLECNDAEVMSRPSVRSGVYVFH